MLQHCHWMRRYSWWLMCVLMRARFGKSAVVLCPGATATATAWLKSAIATPHGEWLQLGTGLNGCCSALDASMLCHAGCLQCSGKCKLPAMCVLRQHVHVPGTHVVCLLRLWRCSSVLQCEGHAWHIEKIACFRKDVVEGVSVLVWIQSLAWLLLFDWICGSGLNC